MGNPFGGFGQNGGDDDDDDDNRVYSKHSKNSFAGTLDAFGLDPKKFETFNRLAKLTGLDAGQKHNVSADLSRLVLHGSEVEDITSARGHCACLVTCAEVMRDEVDYLLENPQESDALVDWNRPDALGVREELLAMIGELEARAGQPEPMKSAAAEKMRCKLEKKLIPKLKTEIPKWAERLRFLQAQVLKWIEPQAMLTPAKQLEDGSATAHDNDGFAQLFLDELEQERLRAEEKSAMLEKKKEIRRNAKLSQKKKISTGSFWSRFGSWCSGCPCALAEPVTCEFRVSCNG